MGQCFSDTASLTDFVNKPGVEDKQLTAQDINRGLDLTAKHLNGKKKQITCSRASTADVDFFSVDTVNNPVLRDGIRSAAKTMQLAIRDGVVIFDKPGLKVVAAPWMYCLVAKLEKAGKRGNAKSYDMSDAAQYLIQESKRRGAKIKLKAYGVNIQEAQITQLKALCGGYMEG
ncbi:hypothetical protein F4604DRAFT_1718011 [Suillus subluteus]|nr:hypothetical protein F4604DRAFT_1718011 [Suillus subluteus]